MALEEKESPMAFEGVKSVIETATDGGDFVRLRGGDSITYDAGERESSTIPTFEGVVSILGTETISDVVINVPAWLPHVPPWPDLETAKMANDDISSRIRTAAKANILASLAARTAAIASATGVVTIAAPAADTDARRDLDALITGDVIKVGHILNVSGDNARTIVSIEVDDDKADGEADRWKMEVLPRPAADVAAATFTIEFPRVQLLFQGGIKKLGTYRLSAGSDGALGTELVLNPNSPLRIPRVFK